MIKENLVKKLRTHQSKFEYSKIAQLLAFSLKENSSEVNKQIFGYVPSLFREIAIDDLNKGINSSEIFIGEPVIYKIAFPSGLTMGNIPFFYLFCYLKDNCEELNVYFQSAAKINIPLAQQNYSIDKRKIIFEGMISAFTDNISTICISDPGHFIPGLMSSFYVGTKEINFTKLISMVVESLCANAQINLQKTLLFGSSAGGMGALLTSTYFNNKVQVLSINSQIYIYGLSQVMKALLGTDDRQTLLDKFGDRVCCRHRFQQNISSVPNIYLLANINDDLHDRNFDFYRLYQELYSGKNQGNQSVFDSYDGVEGHGRPDKASLKKKIKIAKEILTMKANTPVKASFVPRKLEKTQQRRQYIKKVVQNISKAEILEIGAFDRPSFTKSEANIYYCDYFSKEELAKNHSDIKPQRAKNAVDVDYVVKGGNYSEHINKKFDLVIANQVIEHIPNMIKWLQDISLILKKDGFLFLAISHKEYTFDKLRSVTSLDELTLNNLQDLKAPSIHHISDQLYYHRPVKAHDVWNNNYQHLLEKKRFHNAQDALDEAQKRLNANVYVDVHCNVFTYESFVNIINQLQGAQYISFQLHSSTDVTKPHNEFYALLKNGSTEPTDLFHSKHALECV